MVHVAPRSPRRTPAPFLSAVVALCAALCGADRPLSAQAGDVSVVPVRVVNGHLVVLTDLVGLRFTNEAGLEISFEYPDALTLHPDQYGWTGLDPNDMSLGDGPLVQVMIAPGIKLSIPGKDVAVEQSAERIEFQNMMTKLYSSELGERKLKGTIGIGLLKKYHVTLDVQQQQLVLAPPLPPADASPADPGLADVVIAPFDDANDRIEVGVTYGDGRAGRMVLGGTSYDTYIDARVARPLGKPAGDVSPVWLEDTATPGKRLDLSQYMAFRPMAFGLAPEPSADSPVLISGVNFLEYFRVDLDWTNRSVSFTQRKAPRYPEADLAFFQAEAQGTPDAIEAYLKKYPHERLSQDAATELVKARVDKGAADADVMKALQWAIGLSRPGRKTETCLAYLTTFADLPDRADLAIAAGTEGLKYSREAFDARVVYALHHELGKLYLKKGDLDDAWKHLLSAAFMAPDDLEIVLDLARVYDRQGQVRRAYARYKRVAAAEGLPPEIETEVSAAMARLRKLLPKDDPLLRDGKTTAGRGGSRH
jgi:tetratricopeptide (TPR) repeat protein